MPAFRPSRRVLTALGVTSFVAAVVPATVDAASIGRSSDIIRFNASAGETNRVTIKVSGSNIVLSDTGAKALNDTDGDLPEGCTTSGRTATCSSAGVASVRVYLRDGDDTASATGNARVWLVGGPGADTLTGGDGADRILGEEDNDSLAGGAGPDVILGGDGKDLVRYGASPEPVVVSLDGVANDGAAVDGPSRARDNVGVDVENILGSPGDDELIGNDEANRLRGGAGNDTLHGLGGDDRLEGEAGDDVLAGGPGADRHMGGDGVDRARYAASSESKVVDRRNRGAVHGSAEDGPEGARDTIDADVEGVVGSQAGDTLTGSTGADILEGGPGKDRLNGLAGDDTLRGGGDHDTLIGGPDADKLEGGGGLDLVSYESSTKNLWVTMGQEGADDGSDDDGPHGARDEVANDVERVTGGRGDDVLIGNAANNTLDGGKGNDRIIGGPGADTMRGGDGNDTVSYAGSNEGKTITLDGEANDGSAEDGGAKDLIAADIENATGGEKGDSITGNDGPNTLFGANGDDVIDGRGGNDQELGGTGRDVFFQGAATNGSDWIDGQQGDEDLVYYISRSEPVAINLNGGHSGTDRNGDGVGEEGDSYNNVEAGYGGSGNDRMFGDDGPNTFFGGPGDDHIVGNGGDDHLMGNEGKDHLNGSDGNDKVDGGYGADTLLGGRGDDDFPVTSCAVHCGSYDDIGDTINGEEGSDSMDFGYRVIGVRVDVGSQDNGEDADANGDPEENDRIASIERISGTNQRDWIRGTDGDDVIEGRGGDDVINGAGGADGIFGGDGNDHLDGGDGQDLVRGQGGDDTLFQGFLPEQGDDLLGGAGTDTADDSGRASRVTIRLDGVANDGAAGEFDNVQSDIERLKTGAGDDTVVGDSNPQFISGSGGDDQLIGEGGADEIRGGIGADWLYGGDGNDLLFGDDGDDRLHGDNGNDELHGGNHQDDMTGGNGDDAMYGEAGDDDFNEGNAANGADLISCGTGGESPETHPWYDTVRYFDGSIYNGRTQPLYINPDGVANDGQDADGNRVGEEGDNVMPDCEEVWGGKAGDFFEGTSGVDRFIGMEGDDTFRTNGGADWLQGREGDDTFLARDGQKQSLDGGAGTDTADHDAGLDALIQIP